MTTTNQKRIRAGYEPIPGYVLEEVIGRGGFGEVWRASAPGGLKKAVKFVFGAQDQSRAARELRSLERIRGVQHPFLLTLERFEAIDDQLVIVTELADCSLEDVQKKFQDNGSCGIPRDVLLSYLQDAADALDYLHESYQLQHLDIKPGNLLLVGGHVKVADFGLLKDLRDVEVSVVGGLTPLYAPPELFDGQPNMNSDQYSLAVMYQELLTGSRPFNGRTIAQLATQHVHSAPNIDPLPPADRPVVARALEKNPERRFPNCKAFVEGLRDPRKAPIRVSTESDNGEFEPSAEPVEDLPQLAGKANGKRANRENTSQALVVAIGGTGAECLRELRRRTGDLHGSREVNLHSVLIDTDMATIHSMGVAELSDRVSPCHTIYTPLKTAHEYRQNGTERLSTISRRWIYNVPRSGATEGMRPLGRLALVDHGQVVAQRLADAIAEATEAANGVIPSIYVVGSLAGGTCSGMYVDVVHLLRNLLDQAGWEEAQIHSMLSVAPFRADPARPLALHDTHAALTEINHFLMAGNGYPGDQGAGWQSVPAARTPLSNVYLVAGASHANNAPTQVESITGYIWSDITGAKDILTEARALKLDSSSTITSPSIRTVGVVNLGDSQRLEQKTLSPAVVRELLVLWLGLPSKARHAAEVLTDRIIRRTGFDAESMISDVESRLNEIEFDDEQRQMLAMTGEIPQETALEQLTSLAETVSKDEELMKFAMRIVKNLHREISVGLTDRKADVTTVIECLKTMCSRTNEEITALRNINTSRDPKRLLIDQVLACLLEQLCGNLSLLQGRYDQFTMTLAMAIKQSKLAQGPADNPWGQLPEKTRSQFQYVVVQLHETSVARFLLRPMNSISSPVEANAIFSELSEATLPLIAELYGEVSPITSEDEQESVGMTADLSSTDFSDSESQTLTAVNPNVDSPNARRKSNQPLTVEEAVVAVKPTLLAFGGLQRLILLAGSTDEKTQYEAQVRDSHEGAVSAFVVPGSSPKLVHEGQKIQLKDILARLKTLNGSNAQITSRLASRTDVEW